MKRSGWTSPQAIRKRSVRSIKREADNFGYTISNETIDTEYIDGKLIANAELLLKEAVNASAKRDLSVVSSIYGELKTGNYETFNNTPNQRDIGMGDQEDYELPKSWNLPVHIKPWDQRDRLTKVAALVLMELERLDRMGFDSRTLGYDIFNPEARADKEAADKAIAKQSNINRKREMREMLDISSRLGQTAGQIPTYGSANVTTSTQPQFTGAVQPMPQAVPCPVH